MDSAHKPRICISLCEPTVDDLRRAISYAENEGDVLEIRLDCLDPAELEDGTQTITELVRGTPCETILTLRTIAEGGSRVFDYETRQTFWSGAIFTESFFDVELDVAERSMSLEATPSLPIDWSRTICSHHDFDGVPARLEQFYERLAATPARVLKIAVKANDAVDCLPVFNLLDRARADGREMIAIAMGSAGVTTRILGPSRGAFLTYATLEEGTATAPGQITARSLKEIYRLDNIDRQTQIYGLVGSPISHSVSPHMHNAAFASAGTNAVYLPFEVNDVKAFIKRMIHPRTREINWNVRGLSVTAPHKFAVMDHLDWVDPAANQIGAVNTIVIEDDALHGYNTDGQGLIAPLVEKLGNLTDARCAVIGSGGVANAALYTIKRTGAQVSLRARDAEKGQVLARRFGAEWIPASDISFKGFDVVINATPLGTAHQFQDETPATCEQLQGARLAYDLVYNPTETRFLREAQQAGCDTLGGLAMLVAQAVEQFRLWTGQSAPRKAMFEAARRGLER